MPNAALTYSLAYIAVHSLHLAKPSVSQVNVVQASSDAVTKYSTIRSKNADTMH